MAIVHAVSAVSHGGQQRSSRGEDGPVDNCELLVTHEHGWQCMRQSVADAALYNGLIALMATDTSVLPQTCQLQEEEKLVRDVMRH